MKEGDPPCSDKAWHTLWDQFNRLQGDVIRVDRDALNEVAHCGGGVIPLGLVATDALRTGKTVAVRRDALYLFLSDHPKVCLSP